MSRLLGLVIGFIVGAALGATLVVLFSPVSGDQLVRSLKDGYTETMAEARSVSAQRRAELEAELKRRQSR
jgi:gas vesicle protein